METEPKIRVTTDGIVFFCLCPFELRHLPKSAGFRFSKTLGAFYTSSPQIAAKLKQFATPTAKKELDKHLLIETPWEGPIPHPEHLTPYDFQLEAAHYALSRNRSYLGLDPGLGKTIVAALVQNALGQSVVYICPPFLVTNTRREFEKWGLTDKEILIVPDSMIHKPETIKKIKDFVKKNPDAFLVIDENHRFKNQEANRTKSLFKYITPLFSKVVAMSGTPMPNRPIELYSTLNHLAPETIDFQTHFEYGKKYCKAWKSPWGWDFTGASNMVELRGRVIGPFMLRLKKKDVLKELPPKLEEIVIVADELPPKIAALESSILEFYSPEDLYRGLAPNGHLATYRRELGTAKLKASVDFIKSVLEETEEKILIFAHHKDVINGLEAELFRFDPLVITGKTEMGFRDEIVNTFQASKAHRVFIGNIQAAGTGFTLTKATRVIFLEFSWTPADNEQASDRAHRIGQTEPVLVQYLVFKNSVDRAVIETVLDKKRITNYL